MKSMKRIFCDLKKKSYFDIEFIYIVNAKNNLLE